MAKRDAQVKTPGPDDEVRYVGKMRRSDRARFKYFCDRLGMDAEDVGPRWILERLAQEERKLSK